MKKAVCLCQGGNSRSAGLGYLLKYEMGWDALAASWEKNERDTLDMLFRWADVIIIMQEEFQNHVPRKFWPKLAVVDVGPDVWFNSLHPELLAKCRKILSNGLAVGRSIQQGE